jgi:hypothetical protein
MATSKDQNEQRVQPVVLQSCPFCGSGDVEIGFNNVDCKIAVVKVRQ